MYNTFGTSDGGSRYPVVKRGRSLIVRRAAKEEARNEAERQRQAAKNLKPFDFDAYGDAPRKAACTDTACARGDIHPEHKEA